MIPILHANMSNNSYHDYGEPDVSSIEREIEFDGNESISLTSYLERSLRYHLK